MGKNTSPSPYKIICGCDCAYSKDGKIQVCASVLTKIDNFEVIEYAFSKSINPNPYIAGRFYLREGDITISTIKKLKNKFDLLLINGHGKANIEGIGLASYIGENIKVPTIGIAKELLFGSFSNLGFKKGSFAEIIYNKKIIGYALRTKDKTKPIFISEGYKVNLKALLEILLQMCIFKIPEPLRIAHIYSKKILRCKFLKSGRKSGF